MLSAYFYEKGPSASANQDALVLEIVELHGGECALAVVCDGIGGLQKGDYASSYVTGQTREWFYGQFIPLMGKRKREKYILKSAVHMLYGCNRHLRSFGRKNQIQLGTTVTMLLTMGSRYLLLHVGDSRAYLFYQGKNPICKLRHRKVQISRDDSCPEGALTKCIGSFPWQKVQIKKGSWGRRSAWLLCSDGFWKCMTAEELRDVFTQGTLTVEKQLEKRLQRIGRENISRGEKDNQTAIYLQRENKKRKWAEKKTN